MSRKSGVLMHVSSLPGEYSCGAFGKEAKAFVDFLADCGFSYWQVLPFCMVDECNSPYKSYSTFGGNPYFVDLDTLYEKGLLTRAELDGARQQTPYSCEFVRLYHTRFDLLRRAAGRTDAAVREKIESFIAADPYLEAFCRFMSLKHVNGELPWFRWTRTEGDEETLFLWKFIQYEFFTQWAQIKAYANARGVRVIGDVPIYVALDSCDVYSAKHLFCIDGDNKPSCVAGVPPDYFSEDGQLWGNPLYDWDAMAKDGYTWWRDRLRHALTLFDGVRIDHFRGLESYWAVPGDAKTAREGAWKKGPGMALIRKLREVAGDRLIIAEDLGDITPAAAKLVADSGFPGMRVFQFAFLGDGDNPHLPHNYVPNCVAYTGTHDNNTLLGYLWEMDGAQRSRMLEYCGYTGADWTGGCPAIVRTMFASAAGLLILPIQDLLGYGSDTRLNIPGKADGNWQYRVTREQLDSIDRAYWRRLHDLYKR
ncbi:MAG: 4-alpha-glucanotransferase [Clostridia bacterium]|nr:4-alpha-glucanotransferase [Clostridia bacterium]